MQITIKELSENDIPLWDAYVNNHSDGTVFHLSQWKQVIERTFGHKSHYLMALNSQQVPAKDNPPILRVFPPFSPQKPFFI